MNILFFGSSIHSLKIVNALKNYNLVGLVSQSDKPIGRKQITTPTPVSDYARKHNLPLYLWDDNHQHLLNFVKKLNPDLIIVAYFGQKIPAEIINFPKYGSLNIHPSLLPKYPGSSPAVWAILEGESKTGVTILKMNEKFDAGDIIAQETEEIKNTDTPGILYERLFQKGANLLIKILPDYLSGKITPYSQSPRSSLYARRLTKQDGKIDWSKPPEYIERFIRSMHPWPGAWTEVEINGVKKRLKFLPNNMVQLEGKNPVSFKQFKEAYHLDTNIFTSNT